MVTTFEELATIEPKLQALFLEAKRYPKNSCHVQVWYDLFKPRLVRLVGWGTPKKTDSRLRTNTAYDKAYQTILNALPGCPKNCHGCD